MELTPEQLAAAKYCKTPEELLEKARCEGFPLTFTQAQAYLEANTSVEVDENDVAIVSGGCGTPNVCQCEHCGNIYGSPLHEYTLFISTYSYSVRLCDDCYRFFKHSGRIL